jgi:hypothetical protein
MFTDVFQTGYMRPTQQGPALAPAWQLAQYLGPSLVQMKAIKHSQNVSGFVGPFFLPKEKLLQFCSSHAGNTAGLR